MTPLVEIGANHEAFREDLAAVLRIFVEHERRGVGAPTTPPPRVACLRCSEWFGCKSSYMARIVGYRGLSRSWSATQHTGPR